MRQKSSLVAAIAAPAATPPPVLRDPVVKGPTVVPRIARAVRCEALVVRPELA